MLSEGRDSLLLSESPAWLQAGLLNGTNLSPNTGACFCIEIGESEVDLESHRESSGWSRRTEELLEEFRQLRKVTLPVAAVLIESRTPGCCKNDSPMAMQRESGLIRGGGGASREFSFAYDPSTKDFVEGLFPVLDAKGDPIVFPNGRPMGLRFGLTRQLFVVERARQVHDIRQMHTAHLFELCSEAGALLLQLPAECLRHIWFRWGNLRNAPRDPDYRWLDTLFEFEWSNVTGKPVKRCVWRSGGASSLALLDDGLFPRLPTGEFGGHVMAHDFPSEGGYPFTWGSELDDVTSSSISLLQWISTQEWANQVSQKSTSERLGRVRQQGDRPIGAPPDGDKAERRFRVALSFAGERRAFIAAVAEHIAARLGKGRVLYDKYYEAEFARPNLDTYLQQLYHDESELNAIFLCADYERKEWCGLEWRAIRELIKHRQFDSVMLLRFDNTEIDGVYSTDGYVWIGERPPHEIAELILQRIDMHRSPPVLLTPSAGSDVTVQHAGTETALSSRPIPVLRLAEDCEEYPTPAGPTHWFRLWIDNTKELKSGRDVEVVATRVFRIIGGHAERVRSFVQSSLVWTHDTDDNPTVRINPSMGRLCDIGYVPRDSYPKGATAPVKPGTVGNESRPFIVHTRVKPSNHFNHLLPGDYKIELAVVADGEPELFTLEISWTGFWHDNIDEMANREVRMSLHTGPVIP